MSFRIMIDGVQLFGNNECPAQWTDFLKTQDVTFDENGGFQGEINDFESAVIAIENFVKALMAQRKEKKEKLLPLIREAISKDPENKRLLEEEKRLDRSMFDFSASEKDLACGSSLFDIAKETAMHGYVFMPFAFYLICKDKLEPIDEILYEEGRTRLFRYKLKEGCTISVRGG